MFRPVMFLPVPAPRPAILMPVTSPLPPRPRPAMLMPSMSLPAPIPRPAILTPERFSPAPIPRPAILKPAMFLPAPMPKPAILIPVRSSPAPTPSAASEIPVTERLPAMPSRPIWTPRKCPPPGITPRERPVMMDSSLSLRGCQRVTLIPFTYLTWLSRKLKRNPLNSLELPKLRPQVLEGMSRLWVRAAPAVRARPRRSAAPFVFDLIFFIIPHPSIEFQAC